MREKRGEVLAPAPDGYPIKMVRDRTPEIINSTGEPGDLWYAPMPRAEHYGWLRKKLGEETFEYLIDGGIDELAQVLSVVIALAEYEGSDLDELLDILRDDPRGGFSRGVMMYGRHPEYDRNPPSTQTPRAKESA